MKPETQKSVAIIVAHPDDETLWAGGTILSHPEWKCFVVCLTRANDKDRAFRFHNALKELGAEGVMGDIDDGPEQHLLNENEIENTILKLLPRSHYYLIITHNVNGEYTRHRRHEEVNRAVVKLWKKGKISTNELWTFAYEDGKAKYFPKAIENATFFKTLPEEIWQQKLNIINQIYGFKKNSWETETTPLAEAFWQFTDPQDMNNLYKQSVI